MSSFSIDITVPNIFMKYDARILDPPSIADRTLPSERLAISRVKLKSNAKIELSKQWHGADDLCKKLN